MSTGTFVAGLNEALHHEMAEDPSLLVLGEDVAGLGGLFNVTAGLADAFPGRVLDTPISEGGFVGMGVGAAMAGHRVVVEIQVIDFLLLAADQLAGAGNLHFVSGGQITVPIVVRGPSGTGTGFGVTHSQRLEAIFTGRPGLKVLMPSTPADAKGLLASAIRDPNPVVIFEDSTLYYRKGELPADGVLVPIGSARIAREGGDITLATSGRGLEVCLRAAELLTGDGIDAEIVDLRTLKPVDWETIETSVARTGRFAAAFDGPGFSSYGSYLAAEVARRRWDELKGAPRALGGRDVAGAPSEPAEACAGISAEGIADEVRGMVA